MAWPFAHIHIGIVRRRRRAPRLRLVPPFRESVAHLPEIDREFHDLLRDALAHVSERERVGKHGVTLVATQARTSGVPIERVIIALKSAWLRVPEVKQIPDDSRDALLNTLVTTAIKAYFATEALG